MPPSLAILATDTEWTLVTPTQTQAIPATTPEETAQSAAAFFRAHAPRNVPITLAIPANWCLAATLPTADLPKSRNRHQLLTYRLEEHLPLTAEDFVADFTDTTPDCLAIAADPNKLRPVTDALDRAGLTVDSITPTALLHAAAAAATHPDLPPDALLLIQTTPATLDLLRLADRTPRQWLSSPATPQDLKRHLTLLRHAHPTLPLVTVNLDPALAPQAGSQRSGGPDPSSLPSDLRPLTALPPSSLLPHPSAVNLRRGPLASPRAAQRTRRPAVAAAAAAVFLLLTTPATLLYRSHQYDAITNNEQRTQERLFHQTLPTQSIPLDIPARLASEHRRLSALTGTPPDPASPLSAFSVQRSAFSTPPPALTVLHQTLKALPKDSPRYRLFDLTIDAGRFTMEGQTRAHADAATLAAALRTAHLDVTDPHTEQLTDNTVSFTLTGSLPPSSSSFILHPSSFPEQ